MSTQDLKLLYSLCMYMSVLIQIQHCFTGAIEQNKCNNEASTSSSAQYPPPPSPFPQHCKCQSHDGTGARLAYLITLHNSRTLEDAVPLLKSISAPGSIILIHIDSKLNWTEYETSKLKAIVEDQDCLACNTDILVESLFNIEWGSWSMNDPTHWSMHQLITNPRFANRWDVYINLSADSLPVYTPQILSRLFNPNSTTTLGHGPLYGINFVTTSSCPTGLRPTNIYDFPERWHKRAHYSHHRNGTRHDTDLYIHYDDDDDISDGTTGESSSSQKIVIYFGSQWMMLTPSFVSYLVNSLKNDRSLPSMLKRYFIRMKKLMTDETFIPTILSNHEVFKNTLPTLLVRERRGGGNSRSSLANVPNMVAARYERMDEHTPTAFREVSVDQRYDVPESSGVDVPKSWGPYYLGVYDLANIRDSGAIFIRKVTRDIDSNLLRLLPVNSRDEIPQIQWPKEVKIIHKPDWGSFERIVADKI